MANPILFQMGMSVNPLMMAQSQEEEEEDEDMGVAETYSDYMPLKRELFVQGRI